MQNIIAGNLETSLEIRPRKTANGSVYFNLAYGRIRLFIPQRFFLRSTNKLTVNRLLFINSSRRVSFGWVWIKKSGVGSGIANDVRGPRFINTQRRRSYLFRHRIVVLDTFTWTSMARYLRSTTISIYSLASTDLRVGRRLGLLIVCPPTPSPSRSY